MQRKFSVDSGAVRRQLFSNSKVASVGYLQFIKSFSTQIVVNTLRTGYADLRLYITTVQDG